jgi:hypothetical protein
LSSRDFPVPHEFSCRRDVGLDASRFANDAPEEFVDSAVVERAGVDVLQTSEDVLLAVGIAGRQASGSLQRAHFERETRSDVQQAQQFGVDFVDLLAPMFYVHHDCSVWGNKKPAATFRIAAGSFEGVVLAF